MRSLVTLHTVLLALVIGLAACDNFVLADQYQVTIAPLSIKAGTFEVQQGETTILEARGGTAPYAFSLPGPNLFYHDDGAGELDELGFDKVVAAYTASESIGIVIVRVVDAEGVSHESPITIRAAMPEEFAAGWLGDKIRLTWANYTRGGVDELRIERSKSGEPYDVIGTPAASDPFFDDDDDVSPEYEYRYRIYAVAADPDADERYESAPASVTVPIPD